MFEHVKIIVVLGVCHFAAYYFLSIQTPYRKQLKTYFAVSMLVILAILFVKIPVVSFFIILAVVGHFAKKISPTEKLALYFGILFSFTKSDAFLFSLGVPIGYINYVRVLNLGFLLPLIIFSDKRHFKFNTIDYLVIGFFSWQLLLHMVGFSITVAMRTNVWVVVDYIIPYFAIRILIKDYYLVFVAILFAILSQAFVAICEGLLTWKIYSHIEMLSGFPMRGIPAYYFRNGFLRVEASYNIPLVTSLFCNFTFLCSYVLFRLEYLKSHKGYKWWITLGFLTAGILATFFTGSRAGLGGLVVIILVYHVVSWALKRKKDPKKLLVGGFLVVVIAGASLGHEHIKEEWGYRYQLIEVSLPVIMSNWFSGSMYVTDDPRMQVMMQGEGIIDLVNSYIYFALYYGLPGLLLFLFAVFSGMLKTYNFLRSADGDRYALGLFCLCSLIILILNIATTSPIGLLYYWIWFLLAICSTITSSAVKPRKSLLDSGQSL